MNSPPLLLSPSPWRQMKYNPSLFSSTGRKCSEHNRYWDENNADGTTTLIRRQFHCSLRREVNAYIERVSSVASSSEVLVPAAVLLHANLCVSIRLHPITTLQNARW